MFFLTFCWRLRLVGKLHGEVRTLTEPVTGRRKDALQQGQTRFKICSDGFLSHSDQSVKFE